MSQIGTAFVAKIASVSALVTLLGTRVFADEASSNVAMPYLVFSVDKDIPEHTHAGACEMRSCTIDVEIHASTAVERETVDEALRNALDGGQNKTWGSLNIRSCTIQDSRTDKQTAQDNSQVIDYIQDVSLLVFYRVALPTNL